MAAGIAHEIRNPLASMSGSIQILRQELPLSSEQEQLMDIVLRESERLNTTIRSFLAYARPQRFQIARFDAAARAQRHGAAAAQQRRTCSNSIRSASTCRRPSCGARPTKDRSNRSCGTWRRTAFGPCRTARRLHLVGALEPSTDGVVLTVSDDGIGIPPEELDALFQPFHGTFAKGSGLGLAIVHRIVSDYSGEIRVSSQPGPGADRLGAAAARGRRWHREYHGGSQLPLRPIAGRRASWSSTTSGR